jgi:hypothetical protein
MPVCGQLVLNTGELATETYGNKCDACAEMKVVSYTEGACDVGGLTLLAGTECANPRPEICTMEYNPVCGFTNDGSRTTYGNECSACSDITVQWYFSGECGAPEDDILK